MAQPRFQLVPGYRLLGGSEGGVGWRLLGANNRELGRSSRSFVDAECALDAIGEVRHWVANGVPHIVHDSTTATWSWHLDGIDGSVANAGRGFRHERECRYNLEQFRVAAPTAPASDLDGPREFPWQRSQLATVQPEVSL